MLIINVGATAAHAGPEVASGASQDYGGAAGHVFATVVADAFDDGNAAGVSNAEAFARLAGGKQPASGGAVHHGVADDDVLAPGKPAIIFRRAKDYLASVHSFGHVVVGFAEEFYAHAGG